MFNIKIYGLGGQGVVTAGEIIAQAAWLGGNQAQAFPSFGPERTGALVASFVRISAKPIRSHTPLEQADLTIVLEEKIISRFNKFNLKQAVGRGRLLINSAQTAGELAKQLKINPRQITARNLLGLSLANTALLGCLPQLTDFISFSNLQKTIKEKFAGAADVIKQNLIALKQGHASR